MKSMTQSWLILMATLAIFCTGFEALADDFELWDDQAKAKPVPAAVPAAVPTPVPAAIPAAIPAPVPAAAITTIDTKAASTDSSESLSVVRFGAGASWQVFLRMEDKLTSDRVMSDFSFSWAPFGLLGEIGADMSIGRDGMFIFHPNLKFFFVKNQTFSLYLEGACDVLSFSDGIEIGGGAGLGVVFGLMDNLAIEVRAGASVFDFSDQAAVAMLGLDETTSQLADSNLSVLPTVTARLMARF